jgi:hypothetical protein
MTATNELVTQVNHSRRHEGDFGHGETNAVSDRYSILMVCSISFGSNNFLKRFSRRFSSCTPPLIAQYPTPIPVTRTRTPHGRLSRITFHSCAGPVCCQTME